MSSIMENYHLLTPYGEEVFVKIKQIETPLYFDGRTTPAPSLPTSYLGKLIKVVRTGSHTWQPVESDRGWRHHIYGLHVSDVYTLETHPELFI